MHSSARSVLLLLVPKAAQITISIPHASHVSSASYSTHGPPFSLLMAGHRPHRKLRSQDPVHVSRRHLVSHRLPGPEWRSRGCGSTALTVLCSLVQLRAGAQGGQGLLGWGQLEGPEDSRGILGPDTHSSCKSQTRELRRCGGCPGRLQAQHYPGVWVAGTQGHCRMRWCKPCKPDAPPCRSLLPTTQRTRAGSSRYCRAPSCSVDVLPG